MIARLKKKYYDKYHILLNSNVLTLYSLIRLLLAIYDYKNNFIFNW